MREAAWVRVLVRPILLSIAINLCWVVQASAACTQPPPVSPRFPGTLGSLDSPFLLPGATRTVDLKTSCTASSGNFEKDDVVTLVFKPPSGETNVIVLKENCAQWENSNEQNACKGHLNGGGAHCGVTSHGSGTELSFKLLSGNQLKPKPAIDFAGPVTVAVTAMSDPLPCGLATEDCSSFAGPLRACVDHLYDAQCKRHPVFPGVTALPPFNNFAALKAPNPSKSLQFAIDDYGNILVPMKWTGAGQGKINVFASTAVAAFAGGSDPIDLPNSSGLGSYELSGQQFPSRPRFELGTAGQRPEELYLIGDADKPSSVLRIARCAGGTDCVATAGFFDFSDRMEQDVGPIIVGGAPRPGQRRVCEGGPNEGKLCPPSDCVPGLCVAVRGDDNPVAPPVAAPPPPPETGLTGYLILAFLLVGIGVFVWRRLAR